MDPLLPVAPTLTPDEFVRTWRPMALGERQASQSHFIDLCHMLGWPTPTDADKEGTFYAFEKGAKKQGAGGGWADVWLSGHFGWEYKGPKKDLRKAYDQLQQYRESLDNPPLLIVSDLSVIEVHSNFTNTPKRVVTFTLDDLLRPERRDLLSCIFTRPEAFKAEVTTEEVTRDAAKEFATLADRLRAGGVQATEAARELVEKRDRWLNPEEADEAELKKRTLTNLYNARPTWLDLAHTNLDAAVFAAYGWPEKPEDLADEVILERLLALNLERAAAS